MTTKKDLLYALDSLTPSMCKGFAPGEPAGIANSKYMKLMTINKYTADIDTDRISLAAPGTFPASDIVLGSSLKTQYDSYSSLCVSAWEVSTFINTYLSTSNQTALKIFR